MRTLKKTLCLVLCLAMMVGLCAFGASATFTDAADIENKEAVDLMTGIGIIEGYTDGSFNPTKVLNRAEAAKIIAYLLLGKTSADALPKADTKFTDVTAAHWASGYVNYAVSQGILAGKGNNKFAPSDTLKASEWGKMLLCALGYKADVEGLTGSGWDFNVTRLVAKTKLFDGFNASAEMTRDSACLMAYNALTVPMVEYGNGTTVTTGDGTKVETNVSAVASGLYLADNYNLAVDNVDATAANDFDRMGFLNTATVIGVVTKNGSNDSTYAAKTELDDAAAKTFKIETGADLLGHVVKIYKDTKGNAKSVTDIGTVVTVAKDIAKDDAKTFKSTFGAAAINPAAIVYTFTAGALDAPLAAPNTNVTVAAVPAGTYIFNADGELAAYIKSDSVVTLDKVTKINAKAGEEFIKLSDAGTLQNNTDADVVDAYEGIAEKDIVLATKTGENYVLAKAETVNGAATKVTAAAGGKKTITIDGTDYAQSAVANKAGLTTTVPDTNAISKGDTFTLYLDADGKWIACVKDAAAAVATDIRYVAAVYSKTVTGDKGDAVYHYAVVYNTAGETEDVLYWVGAGAPAVTLGLNVIALYTAAENAPQNAYGSYKLTVTPAIANYDNVYVVSKDTHLIPMKSTDTKFAFALDDGATPYLNASTKFIFIENEGAAALVKATVKDGPVNFNYATNTASIIYTLGKDGNKVANAVFTATKYEDAGITASTSIYFDGTPTYDSFDSTGYTYTVYDVATGAEKTIKTKDTIPPAPGGGFYKFTETEDGYTTIGAYQTDTDTAAYAIGTDVTYAGAYGTALHSEATWWTGAGADIEAKDAKFVDLRSAAAKAAAPLDIETVEDLIAAAAEYTIKFDIYVTITAGKFAAAFIAITSAVEK